MTHFIVCHLMIALLNFLLLVLYWIFLLIIFFDMKKIDISRGVRNKNPFNIRRSGNNWYGKVPFSESTDKSFEQFYNIEFGIRAGMLLIYNYLVKGLNTPRKIISRFAPLADGNNVDAYLFFLDANGLPPDKPITFLTSDYFALCSCILEFESNYSISVNELIKLYRKFRSENYGKQN